MPRKTLPRFAIPNCPLRSLCPGGSFSKALKSWPQRRSLLLRDPRDGFGRRWVLGFAAWLSSPASAADFLYVQLCAKAPFPEEYPLCCIGTHL